MPPEIKVCSTHKTQHIPEEWKTIKFDWGSKATEIKIPERILAKHLVKQSIKNNADTGEAPDPRLKTPLEFTDLVQTQILTNTLGLENAAKQTGLSPKTLKRKLLQKNSSYSEILDRVRFELAQSKLKETETSIQTIARELGYQHQANFTRAFKRMSGMTPQEYRNR